MNKYNDTIAILDWANKIDLDLCNEGRDELLEGYSFQKHYDETSVDFLLWAIHQIVQPAGDDPHFIAFGNSVLAYLSQETGQNYLELPLTSDRWSVPFLRRSAEHSLWALSLRNNNSWNLYFFPEIIRPIIEEFYPVETIVAALAARMNTLEMEIPADEEEII